MTDAGFTEDAFLSFLDGLNEPEWMLEQRRDAFQAYRKLVAEELDPEEFKRVDLRIFRSNKYSLAAAPSTEAAVETLLGDEADYAGTISHIDGHTSASDIPDTLIKQGVLFGDLRTLLIENEQTLRPYFMKPAVSPDADRFSAWHAAFWTGGTLLYVPKGVHLDVPFHSLIAHTQNGVAEFGHTLIIIEDEASATLLEETVSTEDTNSALHVGCVELIVGKHANLRYVQLQNWNQNTWHFAHQAGNVDNSGSLQWTVVGLGSKLSHVHQDVNLNGRAATAEVNGVTFTSDRQKISYYTQQHHKQQGTHSDLLYKEVLRDDSRVIWRGMIKVDEAAQQTDGYQRSDALMLSSDARCDSIPGLEIEADDVRCTHGATTGRVDEEQIFYAQSRGISEKEAMHMIVEGFFQQVYDRIPVEVVRETLSRTVQSKLGIDATAAI